MIEFLNEMDDIPVELPDEAVFDDAPDVFEDEGAMTEDMSAEEEQPTEVTAITGNRVSILAPEMEDIVYSVDDKINRALRIAVDSRQGFEVAVKIKFEPCYNSFSVSHEAEYKFNQIKVKNKGHLYEELCIVLDEDGNPIIPHGSATQVTLDEVAGATVTTDAAGVVQTVELDEADFDRVYPCDCYECPLHTGFTGGDEGCGFCGDVLAPIDADLEGQIIEAATMYQCDRACIHEICAKHIKEDDIDD